MLSLMITPPYYLIQHVHRIKFVWKYEIVEVWELVVF